VCSILQEIEDEDKEAWEKTESKIEEVDNDESKKKKTKRLRPKIRNSTRRSLSGLAIRRISRPRSTARSTRA